MMDSKLLKKLVCNKWFLYLIPNLIFAYRLLYYYNNNVRYISEFDEILFSHVIILFFILFIINSIVYLLLNK